jgi:plastocyanin
MSAPRSIILGSFALTLGLAPSASAQAGPADHAASSSAPAPHTIVVTLVERTGPKPFAFEPATFAAQRGDTIKFVQAANTMHNVHFKTQPKGAKLGSAAMSQYLTAKGESYVLVVDSRFADGTYEIVCDPHEMIGMHAFLTVGGTTVAGGGRQ